MQERAEFVRTMGELARPESLGPLTALLNEKEPIAVRDAAVLALQRYDAPSVGAALVESYVTLPAPLRAKARDVLVSRPGWSYAAVSAAEGGRIPAKDFGLEQVRRVLLHNDASLSARAEKLWGRVRPASSRETKGRIEAVARTLAKGKGDPTRGKPIAAKLCLTCHQLFGEGEKIGPDLTAVDRKNLDVLTQNVVDPAGVIREGYQQYVVATADGRVLSGLLAENSGGKVTILDAKGVRTTLRESDVDTLSRADASLMPEGLLEPLSEQDVRDLFAYLRSEPRP